MFSLKTSLVRKMKKPNKFGTFLYRQFKQTSLSPSKILIQPL